MWWSQGPFTIGAMNFPGAILTQVEAGTRFIELNQGEAVPVWRRKDTF